MPFIFPKEPTKMPLTGKTNPLNPALPKHEDNQLFTLKLLLIGRGQSILVYPTCLAKSVQRSNVVISFLLFPQSYFRNDGIIYYT